MEHDVWGWWQVVEGMFVRVSMGADSNGQPYYVVGEVEAVQEASRPYRLPDSRQSCKKVRRTSPLCLANFDDNEKIYVPCCSCGILL